MAIKLKSALELPAYGIAGALNSALEEHGCAVVTAPPGAGKSTVLPLIVLDGLKDSGKVLMLEPRRIAARQIAERMSALVGESVGQTVGYRVRFESRISAATRIEVLTEGILTRMLVDDPTLEGVSAVIFDEFHERSLASDVALALTRRSKEIIRPDLRLVIMSATIDASGICAALGAPLVESEGRMFPVGIVHSRTLLTPDCVAEAVAHQIREAHRQHEGDILAFLPGEADIRRCQGLLGEALGSTRVLPLYGMLDARAQRLAIAPSAPGDRKVVLATPVAETSITIEGVRIVVDSGFCRKLVYKQQSGLSHLETVRISLDMAVQRSGRAGRVAPGICYRLWTAGSEQRMQALRMPEILEADLSSTVLDIAAWGGSDISELPWLTPPPAAHINAAKRLLELLGAIDGDAHITASGRRMALLPCHPRIAQMLASACSPEHKALAADIAAVLEEKDSPALSSGTDLSLRINALREARALRRPGRWSRIIKIAEQYRHIAKVLEDNAPADGYAIGALVGRAYPERIAKACGDGCFLLAGGDPAAVDRTDILAAQEWISVANLHLNEGGSGRIFLAAPLDPCDLGDQLRERDVVAWDSKRGTVSARHESRLGSLLVDSRPLHMVTRDQIVDAVCKAAEKEGLSMLDFSEDVENMMRRIAAVAVWRPELELPELNTRVLLESVREWLPPYIGKSASLAELKKIDLCQVMWGMLSYGQQQNVENLAPSHITVPTGSRVRVEYRLGADAPVLKVRLQECFGLLDTPRVDGGRRPVLMELLSPGFKPVQLTQDLRSFWQVAYFEVRKELRRRYPKHSWPDNPLEAEAVRGVRKRKA